MPRIFYGQDRVTFIVRYKPYFYCLGNQIKITQTIVLRHVEKKRISQLNNF